MNNHTIYNVLDIKAITMMKIDKMGTIYLVHYYYNYILVLSYSNYIVIVIKRNHKL